MNNTICQSCFNLDCPQPCVATDDIIINCLYTEMIEKICKMVEDNYLDDIDVVTETKKKYLKNG